jgi:hypothetical protein
VAIAGVVDDAHAAVARDVPSARRSAMRSPFAPRRRMHQRGERERGGRARGEWQGAVLTAERWRSLH